MAYRSLSRPSSALSAKAFPLRPLQLNLFVAKSASLRFQASLKTARAPLLLTSNSDPLTLGSKFVSGAVPDHGRSQVYLQELGYLSVEVCFLTYPLAICSMIFRSYPNNILEKPYINLLYLSIKRNNI